MLIKNIWYPINPHAIETTPRRKKKKKGWFAWFFGEPPFREISIDRQNIEKHIKRPIEYNIEHIPRLRQEYF